MNLVNMKKADLPLLRKWLDSEHIYRWFGEPEFWVLEFEHEPNSFFMVEHEGNIIGFCRYTTQIPLEYQSFFPHILSQISFGASKETKILENPLDMQNLGVNTQRNFTYILSLPIYFVDYGIGNQHCLGRGFGKKMLNLLCDTIKNENDCVLAAASSIKNISSCSLLKGSGFSYDEKSNLFLKIVA